MANAVGTSSRSRCRFSLAISSTPNANSLRSKSCDLGTLQAPLTCSLIDWVSNRRVPSLRSGLHKHRSPDHSMLLLRLNRRFDRLVHLRVSGAAAQVPAESMANFFFAWLGIAVQERFYRDHETGRAEAALRTAPVAIGFLDC